VIASVFVISRRVAVKQITESSAVQCVEVIVFTECIVGDFPIKFPIEGRASEVASGPKIPILKLRSQLITE
jgi:hypothetical protein